LLALCALGFSSAALAEISQFPLFLQQSVKPNIMFTLDNSGSMAWGSLTGADATAEYNSTQTRKAYHSSGYNQIYYNPATTYTPAVDYKNSTMGNSSPTAARIDAYPTAGGTTSTVNLKTICYATSTPTLPLYDPSTFGNNTTNCKTNSTTTGGYTNQVSRYAFYYNKLGTLTPDGSSGQDTTTNYTRVDIISTTASYPKAATRTDCAGSTCTYDEEIQNFANWFSYYRTRIMMAKAAMGQAFASLDPDISKTRFRVGFNTINKVSGTSVTYNNDAVADGDGWLTIRNFTEAQKIAFFNRLYKISPSQGTPLRTQMDRIGKLYSKTLSSFDYTNNDPYFLNNQYGTTNASQHDATPVTCRASFHIMTTDGYWNDAYAGTNVGNQDGVDGGYSTMARGSYEKNSSTNTLADIAMYYYNRDIRTDLANNVPANDEDPTSLTTEEKKRQRMATFTVGLGADGSVDYPDGLAAIKTTGNWPKAVGDTSTAVDDLWHAAINARGSYFSAKNPTDLREGLVDTLRLIDQTTATASTETASSALISTGTIQYEPSFKSGVWTGSLTAYDALAWSKKWNAADKLPAPADRNITTMKEDGTKVDFKWDQISTAQKTALGTIDVLNYLRGDGSKEKANGGSYRDRATKLGDIVNSAPLYIKRGVDQGYSTLASIGAAYTIFRDSGLKSTRKPMIYVGANDGMLHGFDATVDQTDSGKELFAYIPASVYANLKNLSSKEYEHQYFVDGQVTEGDAYIGGWKTILLGSTGAGAKSVFAIDITNPSSLTKDSVLWEKSGSNDADLGFVLGEARAVTMKQSGADTVQALGRGIGRTAIGRIKILACAKHHHITAARMLLVHWPLDDGLAAGSGKQFGYHGGGRRGTEIKLPQFPFKSPA
jgi:type IV pilus assembly protein PilY1